MPDKTSLGPDGTIQMGCIQGSKNRSSRIHIDAATVTGRRQDNPPPFDCGCVVVVGRSESSESLKIMVVMVIG